MSKVASPVTGKPYGLAAVSRAWRIARSGIYRHRTPPSSAPRRRGPTGALSDAALAAAIKAVLAAPPTTTTDGSWWNSSRHSGITLVRVAARAFMGTDSRTSDGLLSRNSLVRCRLCDIRAATGLQIPPDAVHNFLLGLVPMSQIATMWPSLAFPDFVRSLCNEFTQRPILRSRFGGLG